MQRRLLSLDAFRGATIAAMILVNNPGNGATTWAPLKHAEWHGWTFTDTIFPFFLWIVGVAMTLSFLRRQEQGATKADLLKHTFRRAALIFLVGSLLNLVPRFDWEHVRIMGVLQRIALCDLFAAIILLNFRLRGQVVSVVTLLGGYWAMMTLYPVPGHGPGVLDKDGNFAQYFDQFFLSGHMWAWSKTWDPEGLFSTLPAIATTLFGVLAGHFLRTVRTDREKVTGFAAAGVLLFVLGNVVDVWFPINKALWTSSFVLLMAGLASICFALWYWIVEVMNWRAWCRPFEIFGSNALAMFVLSGALARTLGMVRVADGEGKTISLHGWLWRSVFAPLADPMNASLLFALSEVLLLFLIAWWMYSRRVFVKL